MICLQRINNNFFHFVPNTFNRTQTQKEIEYKKILLFISRECVFVRTEWNFQNDPPKKLVRNLVVFDTKACFYQPRRVHDSHLKG